ncbi:MAG: decaprenyl-phosphate phosphoribosyltransferase [Kiritimatiellia bacterium]
MMCSCGVIWLKALRPAQWLKNGVVAAAWFFALWDPGQSASAGGLISLVHILIAVSCFCLVSSGVYLINDLHDIESDRVHPIKRLRPLASGAITPACAVRSSLILVIAGAVISLILPVYFTVVLAGYFIMQLLYTFVLKRIAYLDVFIIAAGFVLRAIAGALALTVRISPWLLLCTFLLALFLALCKRRHEKILLVDSGEEHREVLGGYNARLLDLQIGVTAAAALVSYSIYTLSSETVARFGTSALGFTIPFVVFGIFRYLDLVYTHSEGGHPEKVLLTDKTLIVTILGYGLTALGVFLWG